MPKKTTKKAAPRARTLAAPRAGNGITDELAELRELVGQLSEQIGGLQQSNESMKAALALERAARESQKHAEVQAAAKSSAQMQQLAPLLAKSGIDLQGCTSHPIIQKGCGECREALLMKLMTNMGGG